MLAWLRATKVRSFFSNFNQVISAAVTGYINFLLVSLEEARPPILATSIFIGFFTGKDSFFQKYFKHPLAILASDWIGILWRSTHTIFSALINLTFLITGIIKFSGKKDAEDSNFYQYAPYYTFFFAAFSSFFLSAKLIRDQYYGKSSSGFSEKPFIKASNKTAEIARFLHYFFSYNTDKVGLAYFFIIGLGIPAAFASTYPAYKFSDKPFARKFQISQDSAIAAFNLMIFFEALYISIALGMKKQSSYNIGGDAGNFYFIPALILSTTYGIMHQLSSTGKANSNQNAEEQRIGKWVEMTSLKENRDHPNADEQQLITTSDTIQVENDDMEAALSRLENRL